MTMGERIRQARMEAGLSQRQLAGDMMTRNMLSALEHDGANPSVTTLRYLSEKLCKPIAYFFGDDVVQPKGLGEARELFRAGEFGQCLKVLQEVEFSEEGNLLEVLCLLEMAEQAREEGRLPYSRTLLDRCWEAMGKCIYLRKELERRWLIASALAGQTEKAGLLTGEDEVLMLRAEAAMETGDYQKAGRLLDAAENQKKAQWNFLRGEVYFKQQDFENAVRFYHLAERDGLTAVSPRLEICYLELGDYKMAYYYAKIES